MEPEEVFNPSSAHAELFGLADPDYAPRAEHAGTGATGGAPLVAVPTGPAPLEAFPLVVEDGEEGVVKGSRVLELLQKVQSHLLAQQHIEDAVFQSVGKHCAQDAEALQTQLHALRAAVADKETHLNHTRALAHQPDPFVAVHQAALHNMQGELREARAALAAQRTATQTQHETVRAATAAVKEALATVHAARIARKAVRTAQADAADAQSLLQLAHGSLLERAGMATEAVALRRLLRTAVPGAAAGSETEFEGEVRAHEELRRLRELEAERVQDLEAARARVKHAQQVLHAAQQHRQQLEQAVADLELKFQQRLAEIGHFGSFLTSAHDSPHVAAAKRAVELAHERVHAAEATEAEATAALQRNRTAEHVAEERVRHVQRVARETTEREFTLIRTNEDIMNALESALVSLAGKLQDEHQLLDAALRKAEERFNAAHERVEKQAPVLQHSIAQLQKGQETLREQTGRVSGRVRALHEELAGVQHDISALAQHCATAAENYAEDTEKRTVQRHAVRELTHKVHVKVAAIQRVLATAHASDQVRRAKQEVVKEVLAAGLRADAELEAIARMGATGVYGVGGSGPMPDGSHAVHDQVVDAVERRHAAAVEQERAAHRRASEEVTQLLHAAMAARAAAREMQQLVVTYAKRTRREARELAVLAHEAKQGLQLVQEHEAGAHARIGNATADLHAAEVRLAAAKLLVRQALTIARAAGELAAPEVDAAAGRITVSASADEPALNATVEALVAEVVKAAPAGDADAAGVAALLQTRQRVQARASLRRAAARAMVLEAEAGEPMVEQEGDSYAYDAAVAAVREAAAAAGRAAAHLAAVKTAAEKAAVAAREGEARVATLLKRAREAAATAERAQEMLPLYKQRWQELEAYASALLPPEVPSPPDLPQPLPTACQNTTDATCSPSSLHPEHAQEVEDRLLRRHAELLHREAELRRLEKMVAEARLRKVTRHARDEDAEALKAHAASTLESAAVEADRVQRDLEEEILARADKVAEAYGQHREPEEEEALDVVAALTRVAGDEAGTQAKLRAALGEGVRQAEEVADESTLHALRAAVEAKQGELNAKRAELQEEQEAADAARAAAAEADHGGDAEARDSAHALAQEADEAAHLTQAEVGQLEAELRAAEEKLQAAEDAAQDRALLRDAPEPEATQEEEPVPEPPRNHLSAVLQEELEAERVTRAADVEALAFTDAPASQ